MSDIVYAVKLAAYTEDIEGEGVIGYVVLSDKEDAAAEATLTDADDNTSTLFDTAMEDAFGSGWAQTARLSYNGWTDTVTMLKEVADNEYAASVTSSTYVSSVGTEQLLADVQNCATALSKFMEYISGDDAFTAIKTLAVFLGDDLYTLLEEAGYSADDDYEGVVTETLSNAVVFCLAKYVNANASSVINGFYNTSNLLLDNELGSTNANDAGFLYNAANWYAAGEALATYLNDDYVTETFSGIDFTATDSTTIMKNMLAAYETIAKYVGAGSTANGTDAQQAAYANYLTYYYTTGSDGKAQAQLDGESYVAILQTVNSLYADYLDSLSDSSLFTSSGMLTRVNSYVAAASLKDYIDDGVLEDVVDGNYGNVNLVLIFTTDENGSISCIACPNDAYTES